MIQMLQQLSFSAAVQNQTQQQIKKKLQFDHLIKELMKIKK